MTAAGSRTFERDTAAHGYRFWDALGVVVMEQRSAAYHRAAATRARRLREEATTRRLKEQLEDVIAQHEQIAAEIEKASEPDGDAVSSQDETSAFSSETPGR
jgi:hypothetical protein